MPTPLPLPEPGGTGMAFSLIRWRVTEASAASWGEAPAPAARSMRARLADPGRAISMSRFCRQRLLDQRGQLGVAEAAPPAIQLAPCRSPDASR